MTLLLIDSASLWYRAYYGMPDTLLSPDGEPINAVKGFIDMTARLVSHYRPNRMALCLDGDWRPSWRVDLFPEYKANRVDDDGEEDDDVDYTLLNTDNSDGIDYNHDSNSSNHNEEAFLHIILRNVINSCITTAHPYCMSSLS